jgi:hypothetical protein
MRHRSLSFANKVFDFMAGLMESLVWAIYHSGFHLYQLFLDNIGNPT